MTTFPGICKNALVRPISKLGILYLHNFRTISVLLFTLKKYINKINPPPYVKAKYAFIVPTE